VVVDVVAGGGGVAQPAVALSAVAGVPEVVVASVAGAVVEHVLVVEPAAGVVVPLGCVVVPSPVGALVVVLPVVPLEVPALVAPVVDPSSVVVPVAVVVAVPVDVLAAAVDPEVTGVESSAAAGSASANATISVHNGNSRAAAFRDRAPLTPALAPTDTPPKPAPDPFLPGRAAGHKIRAVPVQTARAYEIRGGTFSRRNLACSRVEKGALWGLRPPLDRVATGRGPRVTRG
jgi:hypothetical protein